MCVLCIFDRTEGQRSILAYPLRYSLQEFGLGPMEPPDSGNVPSAFFGCYTVLQNDNILRPADGHGFCQDLRRIFICPVKLPHPAEVSGGEARSVRISSGDMAGGSDSGAFLWPDADQPADFLVQLHLRQFSRHQNIQRRKHGTVVYGFSDVHELLLSGAKRLFSTLLYL